MKYLLLTTLLILSLSSFADFSMKILQKGIVADKLPTGSPINPMGAIVLPDGELIVMINDSTDVVPPSKIYLSRSRDLGKTWSEPELLFSPEDSKIGITGSMYKLPDNTLLAAVCKMWHTQIPKHNMDVMKLPLRRYSTVELYHSTDRGKSWKKIHQLTKEGEYLVTSVNGDLLTLANGDLLLSGYLSLPLKNKKAVSGSGFWRSRDGGKTWGEFEKAFTNLPGKSFNEAAYLQKEDGTIVAFARWDSRSQLTESMYKIVSKDNGKTWSEPVETSIKGIYPVSTKLPNGIYILMCGQRNDPMRDRIIHFYASTDGENFIDLGRPYYFKPEHRNGLMDSLWGTTGGAQAITPVGENSFFAVFNGGSTHVQPPNYTYVDSNLIEVTLQEAEEDAAVPSDSLLNPASWRITGGQVSTVMLDGKPALKITGPTVLESKRSWDADPAKDRFHFSGELRGEGDLTGINYFGVRCFKDNSNVVYPVFWTVEQTATTLVESCRAEDMVLKVKDTSKWWRSSYFYVKIGGHVTGRDLGMVEKKNGYSLVHLQQPCGVTMPAGTPVHLFCRGTADVFFADILRGMKEWRKFAAVSQVKEHAFSPRHLRPGTKHVRILLKLNQEGNENTVLFLRDLNFSKSGK